jgi:hypothetical protein
MSGDRRLIIGEFLKAQDVVAAAEESRNRGFIIRDVYAPYAVPGLADAMGLKRSKLPWFCLILGIVGAAFKVWFQFWTSSVDWPINVGGKPWDSLPAFLPVTFEFMVLFAGIGIVAAFLWTRRLFPGSRAQHPIRRSTDDRFVLVIEWCDTGFNLEGIREILVRNGASAIAERLEGQGVE